MGSIFPLCLPLFVLLFGLGFLPNVLGGQGQDFYVNYIQSGPITEKELLAEIPTDGVSGATYNPESGPIHYTPTPSEESFFKENIGYFPSPDDDGNYLRVDMSDIPSLTFHVKNAGRPATLVMNIPGFNFRPKNVDSKDVKFFLFTKKVKGEDGIELYNTKENSAAVNGFWFKDADVKILCHGYRSSSIKPFPRLMTNSYLKLNDDLNIILVDWSKLADSINYYDVAKETAGVGQQVALLIRSLIQEKLTTLGKIHFIGHSLGAHVGGATGFMLQQSKVGTLSRITGLDPAGPGFCDNKIGQLQLSDAKFIDIIHTDNSIYCEGSVTSWIVDRVKGKWGSAATSGHSNFFPNGGRMQPGCGTGASDSCSHSRAYYYMEESFNATVPDSTAFKGCPCSSYKDYLKGNCECTSDNVVSMGEYTPLRKVEKDYFLKTGHKYPYSHVVG